MTRLRQRLLAASAKLLTLAVDPEKILNSKAFILFAVGLLALITCLISTSFIVTYIEFIDASTAPHVYGAVRRGNEAVTLLMSVQPMSKTSQLDSMVIHANGLFTNHQGELANFDTICVDEIFLDGPALWSAPSYAFNTLCLPQAEGRLIWGDEYLFDEDKTDMGLRFITQTQSWSFDQHPYEARPFSSWVNGFPKMYPFDSRHSSFYVWTIFVTPSGQRLSVAPDVQIIVDFQDWQEKVEISKTTVNTGNEIKKVTKVDFHLKRPIGLRILTIVLLTAVLASILLLIVVPETGTVLEVAIGILLGLWGIQGVLIPPDIQANTFVHFAILALYILLAWALAVRFLGRPIWLRFRQKYATASQATVSNPDNLTLLQLRPIRSTHRKQGDRSSQ
jgi:hypothetical protein